MLQPRWLLLLLLPRWLLLLWLLLQLLPRWLLLWLLLTAAAAARSQGALCIPGQMAQVVLHALCIAGQHDILLLNVFDHQCLIAHHVSHYHHLCLQMLQPRLCCHHVMLILLPLLLALCSWLLVCNLPDTQWW